VGCCFVVRLAKNTEADKPIFLRKHLLDVHHVAVGALKDDGDKKLVSLHPSVQTQLANAASDHQRH
jgi:hypothetical protein